MPNTTPFITHIRDLIAKDDVKTAIQALSDLLKDSPRLDEAVQQTARYSWVMWENQSVGIFSTSRGSMEGVGA